MTNNLYHWLSNIDSLKFEDKSVLIMGAGWMARQYAIALSKMKIKDVTVISRTKEKADLLCKEFGFLTLDDNDKLIGKISRKDLTIIATPVQFLLPTAKLALENGQDNILVEKPGSLYYPEMLSFNKSLTNQRVRIAYNRLVYPNLHMLKELVEKEEGITSCNFSFTEWIHTIDFKKEYKEAYARWGITNSSHVITIVFDLIGMPKQFSFYQCGKLDWHQAGSVFVGSGLTERKIPFSYHSNWESAGRWGIEVMTRDNAYRLIPLEELYVCPKGSTTWQKVPFKVAYPGVKQGIAEQIALMLDRQTENKIKLVSLEKAVGYNKAIEKIFGYNNQRF